MGATFDEVFGRHRWEAWRYLAGDFSSLRSRQIPNDHGVYLIRAPRELCRVRGSSDVVYIGQAGGGTRGGEQGIGRRLFNYRGAAEQRVRNLIEEWLHDEEFRVECAFRDAGQNWDPEGYEADLLGAYFDDHYELPPANHSSRAVIAAVGVPSDE